MQNPVYKSKSNTLDNGTQLQLLRTLVEQQDDYIKKLEAALQKYDESLSNLRKALGAKNKLVSDQAFKIDQLKRKLRRRR
jgi:peptidoglycan hydrolase CwlO-like protein